MDHKGFAKQLLKLGIGTCLLLGPGGAGSAAAPAREWYTLVIDGQRVGYAWHETQAAADERIDSQGMRVYVSQLQRSSMIETVTEVGRSTTGAPRWIRVQSVNGPDRNAWKGTVSADGRSMEVTMAGSSGRLNVRLPANLLWPDQLAGALRRVTSTSHFQLLDTSYAAIAAVEAARVPDAAAPGQTRIRVTSTPPGNPPRTEFFWLDGQSRVVRRERSFFAVPLHWETCQRDCDAYVQQPYDLMARMVVASPFRIPASAFDGPIRYVIRRADGVVPRLPVTGEQSVVADGSNAVVTICASCGAPAALGEAERRVYLAPNSWCTRARYLTPPGRDI